MAFREIGIPGKATSSSGRPTTTVVLVNQTDGAGGYQPMTLAGLGTFLVGADEPLRWRLVAEFLEEYRWESPGTRWALLATEPAGTGDERWDVFLAAVAEHLAPVRQARVRQLGRT